MIEITAARWVPPFAQGYVRDLRARWVLEEAGLPYRVRHLTFAEWHGPEHRRAQPFGQLPTYADGEVRLFESGAIVLHVARGSPALWPETEADRATATAWLFAALNSVEPLAAHVAELRHFPDPSGTAAARLPFAEERARVRLAALAEALRDRDHLCGRFTAADILMADVLRVLDDTGLVEEQPTLLAYRDRCLARPAFRKALADQLADFAANAPTEEALRA